MVKYFILTFFVTVLLTGNIQANAYNNDSGTIGEMLSDEAIRHMHSSYSEVTTHQPVAMQSKDKREVSDPMRSLEYWYGS